MGTTSSDERATRRTGSARVRLFAAQVAVVLLALLASLLITRQYLLQRLDVRIDAGLAQEADEFRALATTGVDPVTGRAFDDPRRLLRVHLQRSVPQANETVLALVDGVPDSRVAQAPPARLDLDPTAVRTFAAATDTRVGEVDSTRGVVRYRVVPVTVEGSPERGALVVGVFRDLERREVDVVTLVLAGAGAIGLLLAGVAAWVMAGRVLRPVDDVRRAAEEIQGSDLSRRLEVRGTDEVAQLAQTFNAMLDRLERAFADQRQFLDDAGHELRTPVTIVRGHLETMGDDPASRAAALAVADDELDRMARLVDDLLTLARADDPDFVVTGDVEVSELTLGVLTRARALGDRDWQLDDVGAGFFHGDEQRLLQAMLQLAQNAVAHTGIGDTIRIGSAVDDGHVDLWVHDTGPGIARADRQRVMDRFVRTGTSRAEGSGLGLAIVGGIARAHGGSVVVDDTAVGARVRLHLPVGG
ncbi:sensor histidine kinase [Oryzobacter terrae]|uniref:sensor histidine kinase n=1 Tax=Oryzobacter terrae TaxID=1620385 RepID=UPI00366FB778